MSPVYVLVLQPVQTESAFCSPTHHVWLAAEVLLACIHAGGHTIVQFVVNHLDINTCR